MALFSTIRKEKTTFVHSPLLQMYAPNPYCAYIPCSIIIETLPEKEMPRKRICFLCLLLLCALVPWDMGLDVEIYLGVYLQGDFGN